MQMAGSQKGIITFRRFNTSLKGFIIRKNFSIPGCDDISFFKGKMCFFRRLQVKLTVVDVMLQQNNKNELHYQCRVGNCVESSSEVCYVSCRELLAKGASVWQFNSRPWNELLLGMTFVDPEDPSQLFYVAKVQRFVGAKNLRCYCVPYRSLLLCVCRYVCMLI